MIRFTRMRLICGKNEMNIITPQVTNEIKFPVILIVIIIEIASQTTRMISKMDMMALTWDIINMVKRFISNI
jgi:hypothetical protein